MVVVVVILRVQQVVGTSFLPLFPSHTQWDLHLEVEGELASRWHTEDALSLHSL